MEKPTNHIDSLPDTTTQALNLATTLATNST